MTDTDQPAQQTPAPDPGNSPPEQWTGDEYVDDDLDAQLAAALDAPSPLDNPNTNPPAAGDDPPPGSDPDGRRAGDDALDPDTPVPADAVYVADDQAADTTTTAAAPARGAGGKFTGKQQPGDTLRGA